MAAKKGDRTRQAQRQLIEPAHEALSIRRQCALVGLPRSTWYYLPHGETEENLHLMRLLDEQYTHTPFYGIRRMTASLQQHGYQVNHKRVRRLLRLMGLEALYPKPRLSQPGESMAHYPYLLRDLPIVHPNQVWSTDITYVRMAHGFVYLVAVLDWYSRYVLAWGLSNTLDTHFCLEALEGALRHGQPEIFNTDQGVQFTSQVFTQRLAQANIRISWDGRGRALDNIFVERLWRTVKWEEVYLKEYASIGEAEVSLQHYFRFYNEERLHQALGYRTPASVYHTGKGLASLTSDPYISV